MNTLQSLFHLARADFFERARRRGFLLVLAAVVYLGVLVNNGTLGIDLGSSDPLTPSLRYHGELNSAWIGALTVLVVNTFLGLLGFYLVNDTIRRDIRTGVGQIIATTPVSRAAYLVGKWISNFAVLALLVLILAVAAAVMVLLQGQAALDLGALLMPFLAVALPNMALVAALAVLFETVPWLRGAVGNALYFFMFSFSILLWQFTGTMLPAFSDPIGYNLFGASIRAGAVAAFPHDSIGPYLSVGGYPAEQIKVFPWAGVSWSAGNIGGQWLWALVGLGLILLSALWFARFDPSRAGLLRVRAKPEEIKNGGLAARQGGRPFSLPPVELPRLPLFSRLASANPFLGVLFAELRLLLNGRRWWWWAAAIGLNVSIMRSPLDVTTLYLLPIAWLWPLAIWSEMGNREQAHNTAQMVFSSARPVLRQLPAAWLAGVLATALFETGGALFFLSTGDLAALAGWAGAVVFVPTLALLLGVVSSGSQAFQVVYVIWWYVGPMSKTAAVDFTSGAPQLYLLAAAGLLLLAGLWRGRQVRVG